MAWTLFESFDRDNMMHISDKPFTTNYSQNVRDPNWKLFRLPMPAMLDISSRSTFWRATCSYSQYGVDFRDYIRVRLSIMNPLTYTSSQKCLIVDYFDIKGTNCVNCTQVFLQSSKKMLTVKPRYSRLSMDCNFDTSMVEYICYPDPGVARPFGGHDLTCFDPKHRCSEKTTSTTEFWFGTVKDNN